MLQILEDFVPETPLPLDTAGGRLLSSDPLGLIARTSACITILHVFYSIRYSYYIHRVPTLFMHVLVIWVDFLTYKFP